MREVHHIWTAEETAYLREHYPDECTEAIAKRLKQKVSKVYGAAWRLGLKKTEAYLSDPKNGCRLLKNHQFGRDTQFRTGQSPPNKGLRRPGWHAGRMRETQFKKGQRTGAAARNWRPVGTILPDSDGYLRIKVREAIHGREATGFGNTRVWELLQRHLWVQHHGPIPPKHLVVFKDNNRANCLIGNLELISMADNARRNAMWGRFPRELAEAVQLNGALKRKLRRLTDEKQNDGPTESSL
jgi:hypothetical protein